MALIPYFDALKIAGSLSSPSKMPCPAYGLPASKCKAGGELAKLEGSTCSQCYAKKGNYRWVFHVRQVQSFRLRAIRKPTWVAAMVSLIVNQSLAYFRWHDSGDLSAIPIPLAEDCEDRRNSARCEVLAPDFRTQTGRGVLPALRSVPVEFDGPAERHVDRRTGPRIRLAGVVGLYPNRPVRRSRLPCPVQCEPLRRVPRLLGSKRQACGVSTALNNKGENA